MTKTYAQLAREIAALQAAAQKQLAVEAKGAIAKINETIALYGLTAGDLTFASTTAPVALSGSKTTKAPKAIKAKTGAVAKGAKFSDGQGNQWGGRGPRPAWLRNAIAAGRTLESFAGNAAAAPIASIAPRQIKSGAGSAKAKSKKASAAAKSSPSAVVAAPAGAATTPVKAPVKKVAAKARGAAAGAPSSQVVKPAVKKSAATKGGATHAVPASKAAKKSTGPKAPLAASKPAAPVKKEAVQKAGPARKKAAAKSAARKAAGLKSRGPSAPGALTAVAA